MILQKGCASLISRVEFWKKVASRATSRLSLACHSSGLMESTIFRQIRVLTDMLVIIVDDFNSDNNE